MKWLIGGAFFVSIFIANDDIQKVKFVKSPKCFKTYIFVSNNWRFLLRWIYCFFLVFFIFLVFWYILVSFGTFWYILVHFNAFFLSIF